MSHTIRFSFLSCQRHSFGRWRILIPLQRIHLATSQPLPQNVISYIYIYIQISLDIVDIFCLHIFLLILSYCRINFIIFGGNWLMYLP